MEALPEAAAGPAAPPLEGRRTLRFEDVSEAMDELEQENDQLREEVERLLSTQGRRPSQGSRRASSDLLEDGPRQRWSRAVSAVCSRRSSFAAASCRGSAELDGQLDAALVENHELSDRLRSLERERQRDREAQACHEAAVAELSARVRQLERENLDLEARNEELETRHAASSDGLEGSGSDGAAPARRGTPRGAGRGAPAAGARARRSTQRSAGRSSVATCRPEDELRPSLLRAETRSPSWRPSSQRRGRSRGSCWAARSSSKPSARSWACCWSSSARPRTTAGARRRCSRRSCSLCGCPPAVGPSPGRAGACCASSCTRPTRPRTPRPQDGATCAEPLGAEGQSGRSTAASAAGEGGGPRGSTGSTGSSGCDGGAQAELLALRQECGRLREEAAEARGDAARVPELLSDIIGLQDDELAAAQATVRELEAQARPDLLTRWFDSIACAGARPSPGPAAMPAPPS
ncbi:unnamed protein product [Prorocentrum cordatum]|uniref:Uncharacterized protein n=1 Tax=Prorocentrum cordatum TaxID=2364126 RepID=A0ABN9QPM4_9DINO|nr:unnamed protein product [Polarella glacialis]